MQGYADVATAARAAGVTTARVRRLLAEGRFPGAIRLGPPGRGFWLIPAAEVESWVSGPRKPGRPKQAERT